MMVAMRGMKDISGFNIAALRDNTANALDGER
jgi:hypothetical protein